MCWRADESSVPTRQRKVGLARPNYLSRCFCYRINSLVILVTLSPAERALLDLHIGMALRAAGGRAVGLDQLPRNILLSKDSGLMVLQLYCSKALVM